VQFAKMSVSHLGAGEIVAIIVCILALICVGIYYYKYKMSSNVNDQVTVDNKVYIVDEKHNITEVSFWEKILG